MSILTKPQQEVYDHPSRFRVIVAGRRFGKSVLSCNEILRALQVAPNQSVFYVAPYLKMCRSIMWPMLLDAIPKHMRETNKQELTIKLKGYNSTITLAGADNADSLRGISISFLVCDEIQDIPIEVIDMVLRPAMGDQMADGIFIGTPKGKGANTAYMLYMRGKTEPDWESWHFTTEQGGNVPREEIEAARRVMSPKQFEQEYLASFVTMMGRVYYAFDIDESVNREIVDRGGPILVGMDFNVSKMCAALCQETPEGHLEVFDEFALVDSNTREMCQTIKDKYPNREIIIYPDPAGSARKTSADLGRTDHTIMKEEFKFTVLAKPKHPKVVDRINNLNSLLKTAEGDRKLKISTQCKEVIKCLDGQVYKKDTSIPDKDGGLDHMNDALGYLVDYKYDLVKHVVRMISLDYSY